MYRHIGQIRLPLLLVHGAQDDLVAQSEFAALSRLASQSGNPDVMAIELDANHTFDGKHEELG